MKKGFFDFILAANKEKIHSQVIGWMLSDNCTAISAKDKVQFLQCITNSTHKFNIRKVDVERKDIDVLVECDDIVVAIENKIKSTEHSDQLLKYYNIANEEYSKPQEAICVYLTLLGENASHPSWISKSYNDLLACMSSLSLDKDGNDHVFIEEYINTIERLLGAIETSLSDNTIKKWVFEHHSTTKASESIRKDGSNDIINYLGECQLARFVQKVYYKEVKEELDKILPPLNCLATFHMSETEGAGLIQVRINDINFQHKGFTFYAGIQIQGNVCKINFGSDTANLKKDVLPSNIKEMMEEVKRTIKYKKRNPPKKNAYYSVSKPLQKLIYECSQQDLANFIKDEISKIYEPVKGIVSKYYPLQ